MVSNCSVQFSAVASRDDVAPNKTLVKGLDVAPSKTLAKGLDGAPNKTLVKGLDGAPNKTLVKGLGVAPNETLVKGLDVAPNETLVKGLDVAPSKNLVKGLDGATNKTCKTTNDNNRIFFESTNLFFTSSKNSYLVNGSLSLTFLSVCVVIRFENILYLLQIKTMLIYAFWGYLEFMGDNISSLWGYFELSSSHLAL